jgi:hypothetical protein
MKAVVVPLATEWLKGKRIDEALTIDNMDIVEELALPPVKIHCSVLAEDAIRAAITSNTEYICNEVLADSISFGSTDNNALVTDLESAEDTRVELVKG